MSSLLYKDAVQLNENIEILLGLPGKIKTGVQTEINHVVICTYGSGQEIISNDSDTIIIEDEKGRDVSDYYWWARPGKYTITVATFAICPAMGPEKAPTEIIATSSPQFPVSNLKSYDFDFLKAQLETSGPSSLTRKDITFDFRSSPFNAGLTNLRLTENNTVSSFSAVPKLEAGSSPSSIKSVYLGVNAAPQGLSRLGTPNAILGLTRTLKLNASSAPSSLKAWDDATDDPRSVEVFNLNFLDQPNALPTSVELINLKLRVGPESLSTIAVSPAVGPTELNNVKNPSLNEDPTSLTVVVSSPSVGPNVLEAMHSPLVGPTALELLHSPLVGPTEVEAQDPKPTSGPTNLTTKVKPAVGPTDLITNTDADGDGLYTPADFDDNDSGINYQQGIAIVGATFRSPFGYQMPIANGRSGQTVTGRIVNTPNLGSLPKTFTIDANTSSNGDYFAGWQDHQDQTLIHNPELAVTTVTANWQRSSLALSPNAYDGGWPDSSFDTSFLFSSEKLARFVTGSEKCTVYIKLINSADQTELPWPHNGNYPFIATAEGGSFASEKHFGSNSLVRVHVYTTVNFIISGQIVAGTFEGWNKTNSNNNAFTSKLDYYDNGFKPVLFPNFRDVHFITNADSKSIYLEPMYSIP